MATVPSLGRVGYRSGLWKWSTAYALEMAARYDMTCLVTLELEATACEAFIEADMVVTSVDHPLEKYHSDITTECFHSKAESIDATLCNLPSDCMAAADHW